MDRDFKTVPLKTLNAFGADLCEISVQNCWRRGVVLSFVASYC